MSTTKEIPLGQLARELGGQLTGPPEVIIRGAASLSEAGEDQIAFLANARYEKHMAATRAAAVIVAQDYAGAGRNLIRCQDPYFAYRQAMVLLYGFRAHPFRGIDPRAGIDPTAAIGADVAAGPFVTVCAGASVGDGCVLYPGVFVGPRARLGRGCVLYPNVVVYDDCVLGERVTLHAGTVIGQDGFGYATHAGRHEKIPPVGWVEVGDDVEMGACCAVDRATMGPTVVGAGTKFSNLVTIGHGTRVGRHCLFVAQVGVAGSVMIGDYCALAGQVGVVGHISIGNMVRVGAQSGVAGDVPDKQEVFGSPALPLANARRVLMTTKRLPELRKQLKALQAEVAAMKKQLAPPT